MFHQLIVMYKFGLAKRDLITVDSGSKLVLKKYITVVEEALRLDKEYN